MSKDIKRYVAELPEGTVELPRNLTKGFHLSGYRVTISSSSPSNTIASQLHDLPDVVPIRVFDGETLVGGATFSVDMVGGPAGTTWVFLNAGELPEVPS